MAVREAALAVVGSRAALSVRVAVVQEVAGMEQGVEAMATGRSVEPVVPATEAGRAVGRVEEIGAGAAREAAPTVVAEWEAAVKAAVVLALAEALEEVVMGGTEEERGVEPSVVEGRAQEERARAEAEAKAVQAEGDLVEVGTALVVAAVVVVVARALVVRERAVARNLGLKVAMVQGMVA